MNPEDLLIEVQSKEKYGCNVLEHFTNNWLNAKSLHPKMRAVQHFKRIGTTDHLKVTDTDGMIHLYLRNRDSLRLDLLDSALKSIMKL